MATQSKTGTLTRTSGSTKDFPWSVSVTQGTQSTANNTTVLNFTATVKSDTTATAWDVSNNPPQLAIYYYHVTGANAGTTSTIATATYGKMSAGETKTLTGSLTVTHTTAGKASGYAYAVWTKNNSSGYVPADGRLQTATLTLTDIHRASTVTWGASSYTITQTGTGTGASYSYTANTSLFDYSVVVKVGSTTVTSSNNAITRNQILNAMPTSKTATLTVTLTTKLKGTSTVVGTSTATATVTIDTTAIKPSVSISSATSSDAAGFYAGHSSVTLVTSATNSQGADATKLTTKITGSISFPTSSAKGTGAKTFTSSTIPAITTNASSQQFTINVTVTDSRGAIATTSRTIDASKWTAPKITSFNAYRVASSGSSQADGGGSYVYVTYFTAKFSSGGSVTCTSSGGETITNGGTFALATNATRKLMLTVTDALGESVTQTRTVPTALLPLDLYDNGSGSVGCGIGTVATGGLLKVGFTTYIGSGKAQYNDGVAGITLHSNGNATFTSDAGNNLTLGFLQGNAQSYTAKIVANTELNLFTGSDMADSALRLTTNGSGIFKHMVYSGGKTSTVSNVVGCVLTNTGRLHVCGTSSAGGGITFSETASSGTSSNSLGSLVGYAASADYGNKARLGTAMAINATGGLFWNGHRTVMDYDTGSTGHVIQVRWNSPNLEVYVDGTKVKTL